MRRSEFLTLAAAATALPGLDTRHNALAAYMAPHVAMAEFAGVVAIAPGGRLSQFGSFGGRYDGNARFAVASVAKTFTAATVDALIQTRRLGLDTTLGSLLKPFAGSPITISDLLNHTSGIPDIYSLAEFATGHRNPISRTDYIALLAKQKLQFVPGTKSSYSNSGYALLAFAAESAAGATFAELQQHHVLDPAGLRDTGMLPGASVVPGADPGLPNATRPAEPIDPSWLIGNGSLYSTSNDLLQWLSAIHAGTVIRTRWWPYPWGWGRDKTKTILEGDGRYAGYACRLDLNLQNGDAVVVLSAIQSAVVNEVAESLLDSIAGKALVPTKERTFVTLDANQAKEYEGRYRLSADFVLDVARFGDSIQIAGSDGVYESLDPLGDDRFFFRVLDSALVFKRAGDGSVGAIDWGPGAFTLKRFEARPE